MLIDIISQLMLGVVVALPLMTVRLVYKVSSLILKMNNPSLEFTISLVIKVCLSVLPEMLVTIVFVVTGINTRKIWVSSGAWPQAGSRRDGEGIHVELMRS